MSVPGGNHDGAALLDRRSRRVALATVGPHRVGGLDVVLRRAHLSDGPAWRRVRLDETRLAAAFGDGDALTDWVEHVVRRRAAVRAGAMVPFVVATVDGRVLGECSFAIDDRSGSAELSLWAAQTVPSAVTVWSTASAMLRVLELPHRVPWIVAPVAVSNPGPNHLFGLAGFEQVGTARQLRPYAGEPTDHVLWRLENTATTRDRLRELVTTA